MKHIAVTHPLILILEGLGATQDKQWAFEYRGESFIVQSPFVKIYNKDKQEYDANLLQNILAEHFRGNEVRGITVYSDRMKKLEKLRILKDKRETITQAINKLELELNKQEEL